MCWRGSLRAAAARASLVPASLGGGGGGGGKRAWYKYNYSMRMRQSYQQNMVSEIRP